MLRTDGDDVLILLSGRRERSPMGDGEEWSPIQDGVEESDYP